jgi:hypothetical protein
VAADGDDHDDPDPGVAMNTAGDLMITQKRYYGSIAVVAAERWHAAMRPGHVLRLMFPSLTNRTRCPDEAIVVPMSPTAMASLPVTR